MGQETMFCSGSDANNVKICVQVSSVVQLNNLFNVGRVRANFMVNAGRA